jgi:MerR family transcriptional regulator, thiopeptide resistance regulator
MRHWKVGELARRTGITVRTLHHYDEIGLLTPSEHSSAGYRLYGEREVVRLQQILSLRQLGLSLEEIRACLARPEFTPLHVVELHLARAPAARGAG